MSPKTCNILAALALVALLVFAGLPAIQAYRESCRRTQCHNNLKQWVGTLHLYHDPAPRQPADLPYTDLIRDHRHGADYGPVSVGE